MDLQQLVSQKTEVQVCGDLWSTWLKIGSGALEMIRGFACCLFMTRG